MQGRPTYWWFARFLILRLLVVQVILLLVFGLDLTRPVLLLSYAGLLVGAYLVWLVVARPRLTRLGGAGCMTMTLALLTAGVLGCASWLTPLVGLPSAWMVEHASALFTLVLLLGPATHHWRILEECYYQVYLAPKIERDLGFESDTNTLEGTSPAGEKHLILTHIQPGGLMDRAGFLPGNVVVDRETFTEFWMRLEDARGGPPIAITVASGSHPGPVSERPTRRISVSVPRKNYSAALEEELGFRCEVKYLKEGGRWTGVVIVTRLRPGGLMERAGFQDRDILLNVGGVPDLFARLEQARAIAPVTLDVAPWIDQTDLADRPARELLLEVPAATGPRSTSWSDFDLPRDLGFKAGWERLPHRGQCHGWPIVEDLQPEGILARAGFREKDILLEGFSWSDRWHKARGKAPISVKVASWMEPPPVHERGHRRLSLTIPA